MKPRRVQCSEQLCGRGTFNGAAAEASPYGFATCIREAGHPNVGSGCDSGPAPEPEPDEQRRAA